MTAAAITFSGMILIACAGGIFFFFARQKEENYEL
jgi:hypothetical protein